MGSSWPLCRCDPLEPSFHKARVGRQGIRQRGDTVRHDQSFPPQDYRTIRYSCSVDYVVYQTLQADPHQEPTNGSQINHQNTVF